MAGSSSCSQLGNEMTCTLYSGGASSINASGVLSIRGRVDLAVTEYKSESQFTGPFVSGNGYAEVPFTYSADLDAPP